MKIGRTLQVLLLALCALFSGANASAQGQKEVVMRASDLKRRVGGNWYAGGLRLPPVDLSRAVVQLSAKDPASLLLRHLDERGLASGFANVLYDNRDGQHSALPQYRFPRLRHIGYSELLKSKGLHFGLAGTIAFPGVVFGNSSSAIVGKKGRSLSRLAMTTGGLAQSSAWLYRHNHLYVYPEHRDYDAADRYPAYWPYHVISQGSSGSDRPFLDAIALTLGAFHPKTLHALEQRGLVAASVQLIMRRNLKGVGGAKDFLTPVAHRPVLKKQDLQPERMVRDAAALKPEHVAPLVSLTVEKEDFKRRAGLAQRDEILFDTPQAVARLWRGFEFTKNLTVSAKTQENPRGAPLDFYWRVLRGDQSKIRIEPMDKRGSRVRLSVDWHDPFGSPVSSRIDIGVFASDGASQGFPSILSISFPSHQLRNYASAENGQKRLMSINYDAISRAQYYDQKLYWTAPWSDAAVYDAAGHRVSWRRTVLGDTRTEKIVPVSTQRATYRIISLSSGPTLHYQP